MIYKRGEGRTAALKIPHKERGRGDGETGGGGAAEEEEEKK